MSRTPNKKPSYPFAGPNSSPARGRSSPLRTTTSSRGSSTPTSAHIQSLNSGSTANLLSPLRAAASASAISTKSQPSLSSFSPSISDKYSLSADPNAWGTDVMPGHAEPDDYLHNPDPRRDRKNDNGGTIFTARGVTNLGFLVFLAAALLTLFAGYPMLSHFLTKPPPKLGGYNIGGINATGQVPEMGGFGLIDPDTPKSAYNFKTNKDGSQWELIFSDEFNVPNRTFYPGDDPYWEAVDLHYWQTGDLEWYDPRAVITNDIGSLQITLDNTPSHGLDYRGGHLSSWNKFCFTGGYIEVNVSLPGNPRYAGLWPAVWMMGNLGRAGYGASLEGMWPYSYDSCDWGTLPNQTYHGEPAAALTGNDKYNLGALSYLSGQRLSACTCPGEDHPGPTNSDGTFVGRAAPELDVFEATVANFIDADGNPFSKGQVSQSCQFAPFTLHYEWKNGTNDCKIYNASDTALNPYRGSAYQMAVSGLSNTSQTAYQASDGGFTTYGVEYEPGPNGYVTWYQNGHPSWSVYPSAVGPDPGANISARVIPAEPLYIIMNLGISHAFGLISPQLTFPAIMNIDYVRVYQDPNNRNVGCSPKDFPTEDYINNYIEAYVNPNLTTWQMQTTGGSYNQTFPKNRLIDQC